MAGVGGCGVHGLRLSAAARRLRVAAADAAGDCEYDGSKQNRDQGDEQYALVERCAALLGGLRARALLLRCALPGSLLRALLLRRAALLPGRLVAALPLRCALLSGALTAALLLSGALSSLLSALRAFLARIVLRARSAGRTCLLGTGPSVILPRLARRAVRARLARLPLSICPRISHHASRYQNTIALPGELERNRQIQPLARVVQVDVRELDDAFEPVEQRRARDVELGRRGRRVVAATHERGERVPELG